MEWTLTASLPFSLDAVIRSHGWVQLLPFVYQPDREGFAYTLRLATSARLLHIRVTPAPQGIRITTDVELTPPEAEELHRTVAWMVGLEQDLAAFYEQARHEPKLAHVESNLQGRLLRSATVYEDLVKTILTTNTTWSGTIRMNEALVNLYGTPGPTGEHAFPLPAALAAVEPDELRTRVKVGYRAPYIVGLSQAVAAGELDLESLKSPDLSTPEVRKRLLSIKGVGDYAAANMLLILGHYDFVPVDSYAFKNVAQEWHNGAAITAKAVHAAFAHWGKYQGLAYWFWKWEEPSTE
jgi:3-methyladenine DNA glycosylase/8-oxoguanine DNA glycosylase